MDLQYEYIAHRFKPRSGSEQSLLLFVAPATDIRSWAGVPRKAFDYQHGFQRTLNPGRVNDVVQYFREDVKNISPTSIVVGFTGAVTVEAAEGATLGGVEAVRVRVTVPDFAQIGLDALADQALARLRMRLPEPVIKQIEANVEEAFAEAIKLQDEEAVDESFGIEAESAVESGIDPEAEERSYLADFYAQLLGYRRKLLEWPEDGQLREILYSILKPAIIVDGQHRVFGGAAAEQNMLFAICAIPQSSWAESVYQFVVINQKAKPIKPAFLSSIIATSLSTDEIASVYNRLRSSKIDVDRAEVMDRINTDPISPFNNMIDFEVEGSPGFLQFPGMARLARDFQNIPRSHSILLPDGTWNSVDGDWTDHFFGFWTGVRNYFEGIDARLWTKPSASNPNNLLKIVTLQELQGLMLDNWADSRLVRLKIVEETTEMAKRFWTDFPATFFSDEWRQKGLQTSVGRRIIRDAITETRRNMGRPHWGHRRLGLFKG
ncbi:hypothetical protein [Mesorhizobium sanjuanii]|uniref:hypothetical protein n=1 Tax=Mesorhizobium sanjuanii TaxID=2037900 RepID=UPI001AD7F1DF|nr:hypothetical protein [Mesorhizobium sanjuanii]